MNEIQKNDSPENTGFSGEIKSRISDISNWFKAKWDNILKKIGGFVVALAAIAIIIFGGWIYIVKNINGRDSTNTAAGEYSITVSDVTRKLSAIDELATYQSSYSGTIQNVSVRKIAGISIPLTTNSVDITYSGEIKIGYCIDDIDREVDNEDKKIYINLPEAQVLSNEIDEDSLECTEHNNPLNPIDSEQIFSYLSEIKQAELEAAEEEGIYESAEEHMKMIIIDAMSEFEGYTVKFI